MNLPTLPDWLPWWVPILIAIPAGLWALALLVMPFSVIGVKSRLESIDARLDELHGELRSLVLRLPESPAERIDYRQDYAAPIDQGYVQPAQPRPPIPPQPRGNDFIPRKPTEPKPAPPRPAEPIRAQRPDEARIDRPAPSPRAEPRLDWRR